MKVTPEHVTVDPRETATVTVPLSGPGATAGLAVEGRPVRVLRGLGQRGVLGEACGRRRLRVPYLLVPRSLSRVDLTVEGDTATLKNRAGAMAGDADFYTWGMEDPKGESVIDTGDDLRAAGVQAFAFSATS